MSIQPVNKAVEYPTHSTPVLEKRDRQTDRDRQWRKERERERDRQTDRQTDRQRRRHRQTEKKKKKKEERKKERSDYMTLSSRGTMRFKQLRLTVLSWPASN